jgi:hypothetical protein
MLELRPLALLLALALAGCGDDDGGDDGPTDAPMADAGPSDLPDHCDGPLEEPIAGCAPTPLPSTGDPAQDCVNRINQLRAECQCLPPLARWTEGESCADEQAEYDITREPHAGFSDGICDGGFGQNECPGWGSVDQVISGCLQQMWDEGPGEPFSEHGHYLNMTNDRFTMVACGFAEGEGGLWAVQNFR